jgi:diaminohydroxyphosphoribosylaminopyrimidine deaminase/5-amino-6-(5-phosphoribosylamino)uracil reductase
LWLCHGANVDAQEWVDLGAKSLPCDLQGRQIDPVDMMHKLVTAGLTRVFCEGGGSLAVSLLGAGLVDEIVGFTAGIVLGAEGTPSIGAMGLDQLGAAPRFDLIETTRIGADIMHRWRRA